MDGELWQGCLRWLRRVERQCVRTPNVQYTDRRILEVFFWAVMHDRPISWACGKSHWPAHRRRQTLPSPATMTRRLRSAPVIWMLRLMLILLRQAAEGCWTLQLDGLPLPVGGCSKDPDTKAGRSSCGIARGYKLVALTAGDTAISWRIGPMNLCEPKVAQHLLNEAASLGFTGYVLADKAYDTNDLHAAADQFGFVLRVPRRRAGRGLGHRPHHPGRIACLQKIESHEPFTAALLQRRSDVERSFAHWGAFCGGLGPLPRHVRRIKRVQRWVTAKLILHGIHAHQLHPHAA